MTRVELTSTTCCLLGILLAIAAPHLNLVAAAIISIGLIISLRELLLTLVKLGRSLRQQRSSLARRQQQ